MMGWLVRARPDRKANPTVEERHRARTLCRLALTS
jgi:hypothetical protein